MKTTLGFTRRAFLALLSHLPFLPEALAARPSPDKYIWKPEDLRILPNVPNTQEPLATPRTVLLHESPIAGFRYYKGPHLHAGLVPGLPLRLHAEPTNPYDAFAVEVFLGSIKLGYLPRTVAPPLSRLLQAGLPLRGVISRVNPPEPSWDAVHVRVFLQFPAEPGV